jgi:hypothetical protein
MVKRFLRIGAALAIVAILAYFATLPKTQKGAITEAENIRDGNFSGQEEQVRQ